MYFGILKWVPASSNFPMFRPLPYLLNSRPVSLPHDSPLNKSVCAVQAISNHRGPKSLSLKRSTIAVFQNSAELMGFWLVLELIVAGENADLAKSRHFTEPLFLFFFKSRKISNWNLFSFLTAYLSSKLTAHQVERHTASAVYYPSGDRGPQASNRSLESSVVRNRIYLNLWASKTKFFRGWNTSTDK